MSHTSSESPWSEGSGLWQTKCSNHVVALWSKMNKNLKKILEPTSWPIRADLSKCIQYTYVSTQNFAEDWNSNYLRPNQAIQSHQRSNKGQTCQKKVESGCLVQLYIINICSDPKSAHSYVKTRKPFFEFFRLLTSQGTRRSWDQSWK